ncbi:MAG: metallophosphoesterase family protein [Deltaproteobacteria bacterium]|nr:metallophosphoesterase family protein [Deltaproteobacteria bacterium]
MVVALLLACAPGADTAIAPVVPVMPTVEVEPGTLDSVATLPGEGSPHACPQPLLSPVDGGWDADAPALDDAALASPAGEPRRVHVVLGADGATEMSFIWETDTANLQSRVALSLGDGGPAWELAGASYLVSTVRVHVVRACGLAAGREWSYRVGGDEHWSDAYSFVTAPPAGADEPVRFVVMGDTRGAPDTWSALASAAQAQGAEFMVFTGDAVSNGATWSDWEGWLDAAAGVLASMPMAFAFGNHENNKQFAFALFPSHTDRGNYGVDYGPMHFSIVNDTLETGQTWADIESWLEADLAASNAPWRVPVWHRPAVSSCNPHGEDTNTRTYLLPVVEDAGVPLTFTGHNHNYERSHPWRYGARDDLRGTVHVVSGGGGAPLYTSSYGRDYTAVEEKLEHFVLVDATASALSGTAYDLAGNVVDSFNLSR